MDATTFTQSTEDAVSKDVKEVDILLGQRGGSTHWKGNILLRQFAEHHAEAYTNASKEGKDDILETIVNNVKWYGGRFLKETIVKDDSGGGHVSWCEVDPATARKKVRAQLNDAVKRSNGTYRCKKSLPWHRKPFASALSQATKKKIKLKEKLRKKQNQKKLPRSIPAAQSPKMPQWKEAKRGQLSLDDANTLDTNSNVTWITEVSHDDVIIGQDGVSLLWGGNLRLRRLVTQAVSANFVRGRSFPFNSVMFTISAELQKKKSRFLREFVETKINGEISVRWCELPEDVVNKKLKNACEICILHLAGHGSQIDKSLDELGLFDNVPDTAQQFELSPTPPAQPKSSESGPTPQMVPQARVSPANSPDVSETSKLARALWNSKLMEAQDKEVHPTQRHASKKKVAVVYELLDSSDEEQQPSIPAATSGQQTTLESCADKSERTEEHGSSSVKGDLQVSLSGPMPTARQEEIYQKALRELREKERKRAQAKLALKKPTAPAKVARITKQSSPVSPARKLPSAARHLARSSPSPQRQRKSLPSLGTNALAAQPNSFRPPSVGTAVIPTDSFVVPQQNHVDAFRPHSLGATAIPPNALISQPNLSDAYRRWWSAPQTVQLPIGYSPYHNQFQNPHLVQHAGTNVYIYNAAMNGSLGMNGNLGMNPGLGTNGGTMMPSVAAFYPPMEVQSNNE